MPRHCTTEGYEQTRRALDGGLIAITDEGDAGVIVQYQRRGAASVDTVAIPPDLIPWVRDALWRVSV